MKIKFAKIPGNAKNSQERRAEERERHSGETEGGKEEWRKEENCNNKDKHRCATFLNFQPVPDSSFIIFNMHYHCHFPHCGIERANRFAQGVTAYERQGGRAEVPAWAAGIHSA